MHTQRQSELVRQFVESMPVTRHLGIQVIELGSGRAVMQMANRHDLTFDGAVVQGGIVGVLADYAAVAACGSLLPDGWRMATTTCEAHNIAPGRGSVLVAIGEVIKPGRRHAVARADVYNDSIEGERCLTGLFTATGIAPPDPL